MSDNIQSFRIQIPQSDLDYLHHRLATARWPGELPGTGWTRGIPLDYLQDLAGYWRAQYDWRAAEAQLNAYPQFTTEIDGQTIHFLHVTSKQPGAKPLLITHGFASSVAEFLHLIELGKPWVISSGLAPGRFDVTCRKWMVWPSISVVTCG